MNIKQAKEQIKNAMKAYFCKDEFGRYLIPIERQRPIFLVGAPGIGKTAIMEQVSQELGVGLVSYSMTHHTRQSALGLPFIEKKVYGGREYSVSEYTMSEIIASVYDMMEETGIKEGILFLDEINCVSETLAPAMLQFLQYKIFGRHRVPDGWIVVTAGNPPEYNKSVHEFDIVTMDRLKYIEVEPDFDVWKEYAYKKGVHSSVMSYLEAKKTDFYRVETTVEGKSFVTARGWDDLSEMIKLYEKNGTEVDDTLIGQYIRNARVAADFAVYYELYNKYRAEYNPSDILEGRVSENVKARAAEAPFDERLAVLNLLTDAAAEGMREVIEGQDVLKTLVPVLREFKDTGIAEEDITKIIAERRAKLKKELRAASVSRADEKRELCAVRLLEELRGVLMHGGGFAAVKDAFDLKASALKELAGREKKRLDNLFKFAEEVFGNAQEMIILVTDLTVNAVSSEFISRFGCDKYFEHNKELQFYEREKQIMYEIKQRDLL